MGIKTILTMILIYTGILSILTITCSRVRIYSISSVIFWCLVILVKLLYLRLALSNPGYVVEWDKSGNKESEKDDYNNLHEEPEHSQTDRKPEADISVQPGSESEIVDLSELNITQIRFCVACQFEQPIRSKHCKECEKCIACHDHHCPWIGVCIGERNRRVFYFYLVAQTSVLWWADIWCLLSFNVYDTQIWNIGMNSLRGMLFVVLAFFTLMVTLLLAFHTYLASKNITTWEILSWYKISYLKEFDRANGSPFSRGLCRNLALYCCESVPYPYRVWTVPVQHLDEDDDE